MTKVKKPYWVRFSGALSNRENGGFDMADPNVGLFLDSLTRSLSRQKGATSPSVHADGDGGLIVSAVFETSSRGHAVDAAELVFEAAIKEAGGSSNFPGSGPGWDALRFIRWEDAETTVREVQPVVA